MRLSAIVLGGAVFAAAVCPASAAKPGPKAPAVVNIVATADQRFAPDHIVIHVGKRQTLRFTTSAGVHGIGSAELGIPATMIVPDKPVSVNVTAKKAGTFKVPCTIVCGPGHADMVLTVEVKP